MATPTATHNASQIADLLDNSMYDRLHRRAVTILRRETSAHPLDAADLVHEAFLRIAQTRTPIQLQGSDHFLAVATIVIRHILIDRARAANSHDRVYCIPLDCEPRLAAAPTYEAVPLYEALNRLAHSEERLYRVVQMRFFGGLDINEIATALEISSRTVKRDWSAARKWLQRDLGGEPFKAQTVKRTALGLFSSSPRYRSRERRFPQLSRSTRSKE